MNAGHTRLDRLTEAAQAGVHSADPSLTPIAAREAAARLGFAFAHADLIGCRNKAEFLDRMAIALALPNWFGHNWDAFSDCVNDLSWLAAPGYVFMLSHVDDFQRHDPAAFATAIEIFEEAAVAWASEHVPMWIFIDDQAPRSPASAAPAA